MSNLSASREQRLLDAARKARENAWAPYSGFKVGAAVLVRDSNAVYVGCNVENASYGLSICAERAALFSAIVAGRRKVEALAVAIDQTQTSSISERMPCGACRQVMAEFMELDSPIFVDGVGCYTLAQILPNAFVLKA